MIADDANDFWGLEAIMPMPTKMQIAGDFFYNQLWDCQEEDKYF